MDFVHTLTFASFRPQHETAEEKKARKAALKEERRTRRVAKKATKEAFKNEEKRQVKISATAQPNFVHVQ